MIIWKYVVVLPAVALSICDPCHSLATPRRSRPSSIDTKAVLWMVTCSCLTFEIFIPEAKPRLASTQPQVHANLALQRIHAHQCLLRRFVTVPFTQLRCSRRCMSAVSATQAAGTTSSTSCAVFTTPGCPYCKRAKALLTQQQLSYQEVDVSTSSALRQALAEATGRKTVPQVYINGQFVGGCDDLEAAINSATIQQLLSGALGERELPAALAAAVAQAQQVQPGTRQAQTPHLESLARDLPSLDGFTPGSFPPMGSSSASPTPASFSGADLVEYLVRGNAAAPSSSSSASSSRQDAVNLAQRYLDACVVVPVAPPGSAAAVISFQDSRDVQYMLRRDAPRRLPYGQALNTHFTWGPAPVRPATQVAEDLRQQILALYDAHLSPDGRRVSYSGMQQDPRFWRYVDATAELQWVDLEGLSREELMAFTLNTYNALVIHALVVQGTAQMGSLLGRARFFTQGAKYNIGGQAYTCDDLENGVLRCNRPAASSIGMLLRLPSLSKAPFGSQDPRRQYVVCPPDARIHFALVCGASSCPPIKLYAVDTLEESLQAAAEVFCSAEVKLDAANKRVTMSKIFQWYFVDFGEDKEERLRFLLPYLQPQQKQLLQGWLQQGASSIKVSYSPYNWDVNGD